MSRSTDSVDSEIFRQGTARECHELIRHSFFRHQLTYFLHGLTLTDCKTGSKLTLTRFSQITENQTFEFERICDKIIVKKTRFMMKKVQESNEFWPV
jgi:hypothetical protein